MWLKIAKIVAQVAISTGAADWAKDWLKRQLQKQREKIQKKLQDVVDTAEMHDIKGIYGVTVNRKRSPKEVLAELVKGDGA